MNLPKIVSCNLQNFIGKKVSKKILVIESDDWGSIRMPSKKAFQNLLVAGIPVNNCPYNTFDALETAEDIEVLRDFCKRFQDKNGNSLKVTANFIMANPNFEKIQYEKFKNYHFRDLAETYSYYQGNNQTFKAIQAAINDNVIVPQLHGREHLQVNHWLSALRSGDKETLSAFENGVWGHPSLYGERTGINFSSAFHFTTNKELEFAKRSIVEASELFKKYFFFTSETFIPPRFIWPKKIEASFKEVGVKAIQGKLVQLYPNIGNNDNKLHQRINWTGRPNQIGLSYLIRNVFFEPTQKPNYSWEIDALKRIDTAFYWGKPAVISMHRLNFMGGFSVNNREDSLNRLSDLIIKVQKKYPAVEFLSSNKLIKYVS